MDPTVSLQMRDEDVDVVVSTITNDLQTFAGTFFFRENMAFLPVLPPQGSVVRNCSLPFPEQRNLDSSKLTEFEENNVKFDENGSLKG